MSVLYLSDTDVRGLLTVELAIEAVSAAFRKMSLDEAVNVPRQRCQTDHVVMHVLPAAAKTLDALGLKVNRTGSGVRQSQLFLFDPRDGTLAAILESVYLGSVRTGAASAVATKKLARADAQTLGLLGAGTQARTQLLAIAKVRALRTVRVFARDAVALGEFAEEMTTTLGLEVRPVDTAAEAVRQCDIVVTATDSREPVLFGEWLEEGTHVNLVGSNFLSKAEADVAVFRRAAVVTVDSKEQAKLEAGDFVAAMNEGVLHWSDVHKFAHVLTGRYPGRQSPAEITVFKSLGLGLEDIAVGAKVLALARAAGVGRVIL